MTPNSWRHLEQSFFARGYEQLWAWYSIFGLLLADVVIYMDFKTASKKGIHVWRSIRISAAILDAILMGAGLSMQYL